MPDPVLAQLSRACQQVGAAAPADAVAGVTPSYAASPASTKEAAALLRAAAEHGLAVLPRGRGTRIDWAVPPRRCDLVVRTDRLSQVLEHAAGDLTASAQAGVGLDQLADVLGTAGQRLAVDPPGGGQRGPGQGGSGTVGGLIATGVAGPLRFRYGGPRDLLIGLTVVRADGTIARAGGKVVKNVAGYDIGKLFAGSYGTLGLITEATFRLHPLPQATVHVTVRCANAEAAQAAVDATARSPVAPAAVELHWPSAGAPLAVSALLEGEEYAVAARAEVLRELLAAAGGGSAETSAHAPDWWGLSPAAADGTLLRIGFWPGRLAALLGAVRGAARPAGLDPVLAGSAAAGVLHAALPAAADPAAAVVFIEALRAALSEPAVTGAADRPRPPASASALVLHAPPAVRDAVDMWGPVPSLAIMRAVKDQFDPEHRMAPGRFAGGI